MPLAFTETSSTLDTIVLLRKRNGPARCSSTSPTLTHTVEITDWGLIDGIVLALRVQAPSLIAASQLLRDPASLDSTHPDCVRRESARQVHHGPPTRARKESRLLRQPARVLSQ